MTRRGAAKVRGAYVIRLMTTTYVALHDPPSRCRKLLSPHEPMSHQYGENTLLDHSNIHNLSPKYTRKSQLAMALDPTTRHASSNTVASLPIPHSMHMMEEVEKMESAHYSLAETPDTRLSTLTRRAAKICLTQTPFKIKHQDDCAASCKWRASGARILAWVLILVVSLIPTQQAAAQTATTFPAALATFGNSGSPREMVVYAGTLFSAHNTGKYVARWSMSNHTQIRNYTYLDAVWSVFVRGERLRPSSAL
jgi:hypothetical protein